MKTALAIIFLGILSAARCYPQETGKQTENGSAVSQRKPVEEVLNMAIARADNFEFPKALQLVRSLYGKEGVDQKLILRAETAICAAQAAHRLDRWKGSDFGRHTPWYGISDLWDLKPGEKVVVEDLTFAYFDKVIAHSLRRLHSVSERGAEKN